MYEITIKKRCNFNVRKRYAKNMNNAPKWIKNVSIKKQWYGIRARPLGQPAPLLKTIEPGLIINTAHYRNGMLLAPACAEWVANQIKA